MVPEINIVGLGQDPIGTIFGVPASATFTTSTESTGSERYYEQVVKSRTLPAPRNITMKTVSSQEIKAGSMAEEYAYLRMGVDPEVIAEQADQRARLTRRGRDISDD